MKKCAHKEINLQVLMYTLKSNMRKSINRNIIGKGIKNVTEKLQVLLPHFKLWLIKYKKKVDTYYYYHTTVSVIKTSIVTM